MGLYVDAIGTTCTNYIYSHARSTAQEGLRQSLHQSILLVFNENSIEARSSDPDRLLYSNHDFSELAECKQCIDSQ